MSPLAIDVRLQLSTLHDVTSLAVHCIMGAMIVYSVGECERFKNFLAQYGATLINIFIFFNLERNFNKSIPGF